MIYPAINKAAALACALFLFSYSSFAQLGKLDEDYYACQGAGYYVTDVLVLPDSSVIITGSFPNAGGQAASGIARLNRNGSPSTTFNPGTGPNGLIKTVAVQADGKLIIGGDFTSFDGTACNRVARLTKDGSLDATFNIGAGANSTVADVLVQSDGYIMLAGSFSSYKGNTVSRIVRVKPNGDRDSTFTTATNHTTYAIARQPDGKYLMGGAYHATYKALRRLHADGSLDTTFNSGGAGPNVAVNTISILPGGKICIGGTFTSYNGSTANRIMLLQTNGSPDSGFSTGTGFNFTVHAVAAQPDGKILATGDFTSYKGISISRVIRIDSTGTRDTTMNPGAGANDLCLALALSPDGSFFLGGSFNTYNTYTRPHLAKVNSNGSISHDFAGRSGFNDVVLGIYNQSGGKTILAGNFTKFNELSVGHIVRMDADGEIDTTFNPGGAGANGDIATVLVLPDDKILIGGQFTQYNGTAKSGLALLNADGTLYTAFTMNANNVVRKLKFVAGGKILVAGSFSTLGGQSRLKIARLKSDLTLDNAVASQSFSNLYDFVEQADGKVILVGTSSGYGSATVNNIARLDTLGNLDTAFHTGSGFVGGLLCVHLQEDGKILVGGSFSSYNGTAKVAIARLNADGSLDTGFTAGVDVTGGSNNVVHVINTYKQKVVVGGHIASVNGTPQYAISCLDSTGAIDPLLELGSGARGIYNPGVRSIYVDSYNGRLLIGGSFTSVQDKNRHFFAGLTGAFDDAAIDSIKIDTLVCAGGTTNVVFKRTKGFSRGNTFSVQMSDSAGSFAAPIVIGNKIARGSGWETIPVTVPPSTAVADGYQVRIVSTKAIQVSGASNSFKVNNIRDSDYSWGPTIMHVGDTGRYIVINPNALSIRYSIVSSGASIDSLQGNVYAVNSSFTVRTTVASPCDTIFLDRRVIVSPPAINFHTPENLFDTLSDRFGTTYGINEIAIDTNTITVDGETITRASREGACVTAGYFNLYFENGSGIEDPNNATHQNRRQVLCELFQHVSDFIVTPSNSARVNILIRNPSNITSFNNQDIGIGSGFYAFPTIPVDESTPNNIRMPGLVENQSWITLNSGTDSYSGFALPLQQGGLTGTPSLFHGYMAFNFSNFSWCTTLNDPACPNNTSLDLYSVALHELTHVLGLTSLINNYGNSVFMKLYLGSVAHKIYYSRFDTYLQSYTNHNLIVSNTSCNNYEYQFNPALTNAPLYTSPNPNGHNCSSITETFLDENSNCTNAVQFDDGIITEKIFTPACFISGSSLSHLEDRCSPINNNDKYFSTSNNNRIGSLKRFYQENERLILCDIGYNTNSIFGNNSNYQNIKSYSSTGGCGNVVVAGLNDGIGAQGVYQFATQAGTTINISKSSILSNDFNASDVSCVEMIFGNGTLAVNSTELQVTPNSNYQGVILLRYTPVHKSGAIEDAWGNTTYIYVYSSVAECQSIPICDNLIVNGGFENGQNCGAVDLSGLGGSTVYCWRAFVTSPDLFTRASVGCSNTGVEIPSAAYFDMNELTGISNGETYDRFPNASPTSNNRYVGLYGNRDYGVHNSCWFESISTKLVTSLIANQAYNISFYAKVVDKFDGNYISSDQCTLGIYGYTGSSFLGSNGPGYLCNIANNPGSYSLAALSGANITKNSDGSWGWYNLTFTPTTPNISHLVIVNRGPTTGQYSYIVIDDVFLYPKVNEPQITLPSSICLKPGEGISDLNDYFLPAGAFFGEHIDNNGSYSFNPPNAGVYTFFYQPEGCDRIVPVTLTVNTAPDLKIIVSSSGLHCEELTLSASGAPSYLWSTGSLNSSINVSVAGQYTVSATYGICSASEQVIVSAPSTYCCHGDDFSGNELTFNNITISQFSSLMATYGIANTSEVATNGNTYNSLEGFTGKIAFNGILTIDDNFIFANCPNVTMGKNARIIVGTGKTLEITDGTELYSCDGENMWDGIVLAASSSLYVTDNGTVRDAKTGVLSITTGSSYLDGAKFEDNFIHVGIGPYHEELEITGTAFSCNSAGLLEPYGGRRTYRCIELYNSPADFVIGQYVDGKTNLFSNFDYGIYATKSRFEAANNSFQNYNVNSTSSNEQYAGTGIYVARTNGTGFAHLGDNDFEDFANVFNAGRYGVVVTGPSNVTAVNNKFTNLLVGFRGFNTGLSNTGLHSLNINHNTMIDCVYGVNVLNHPKTPINVWSNDIRVTELLGRTGISLRNTSGEHNLVSIYDNDVKYYVTGIEVENNPHAGIMENRMHPRVGGSLLKHGIRLSNSSFSLVSENEVVFNTLTESIANVKVRGIGINDSRKATVCGNYLLKNDENICGTNNNLGTRLVKNELYYGNYGITLRSINGTFGLQGLPPQGVSPGVDYYNWWYAYTSSLGNFHIANLESTAGSTQFHTRDHATFPLPFGTSKPSLQEITTAGLISVTDYDDNDMLEADCMTHKSLKWMSESLEVADSSDYNRDSIVDSDDFAIADRIRFFNRMAIYESIKGDNSDTTEIPTDVLEAVAAMDTGDIGHLYAMKRNYNLAITLGDSLHLDSVGYYSSLIADTAGPMGLYKTIFAILSESTHADTFGISSRKKPLIFEIAHTCPFDGGEAVYLARTMLALLDTTEYEYDDACANVHRRKDVSKAIKENEDRGIKLLAFPNPTNSKFAVLYESSFEASHMQLTNFMGQQMESKKILGSFGSVEFDVRKFQSGIYFVRWTTLDGNILGTEKVVISR